MRFKNKAWLAALALPLAGCLPEEGTKQLFLAGGHLTACSSMTQDDCRDWQSVRESVFADIPDSDIRTPVDEPVSVSSNYTTRVINTAAWAETPQWQQALINTLEALKLQTADETYNSWDEFKAAFVAVEAAQVNVVIDGVEADGDYLWYSSSSDQWDALHYLKMDDGLVSYTITEDKRSQALALASSEALTTAIGGLEAARRYEYIDLVNALAPEFNALDVEQQYSLLRTLRDEVDYQRPVEYVSLADTDSADSISAYEKFVELAANNTVEGVKPLVLVMTSSSNNNYDVVDYYVSLFEQAGANAVWLPVDRAYRQAVDSGRCEDLQLYHDVYAGKPHQDIYFPDYAAAKQLACESPYLVDALIRKADGVFINGGSQSRSLESLITDTVDSHEMALIRERFESGNLLVGGSSAGTAVLTGGRLEPNAPINPMVDGGTNYDVLVDGYPQGVYNPDGGLGLFTWGVTDTHFSERARETRLIALTQQQGTRFGFGVDETTALVVTQPIIDGEADRVSMSVIGAAGVYITDLADSLAHGIEPLEIEAVKTHYLTAGDSFELDPVTLEYSIKFDEAKTVVEIDPAADIPFESDLLYTKYDNYRYLLNRMISSGATAAEAETWESDPYFVADFSRNEETLGLVDNQGNAAYQSVMVALTPYY